MKKDISPPLVENIAIAIVKEVNDQQEEEWNVYLLNLKQENIEGVLVTSKGYGIYNNEDVKTSVLHHSLDSIKGNDFKKIEPIVENVFGLSNEFWVSFFIKNVMYDKKYVFLPESIKIENFIQIPIINKKGVIIK